MEKNKERENLSFVELKEIFKTVKPNVNTILVVPAITNKFHDKGDGKLFEKSKKEYENDQVLSFIQDGSMIIAVGDNVAKHFPNLKVGEIAFMSEQVTRETVVHLGGEFGLTIPPHVVSYTRTKR
jgi:hypothetical protein